MIAITKLELGFFQILGARLSRAFIVAGFLFGVGGGLAQTLQVQSVEPGGELQPAQSDSVVAVTADAYGLSQTPLASLPVMGGTFWIVENNGVIPPFPCLPVQYWNCQAWEITDGIYLVDGTGGQVPEVPRRLARQSMTASTVDSVQAAVDAQGNAVANLIEQVQDAQMMRETAAMFGLDMPMLDSGSEYSANFAYSFDTNALWLEITNVSNGFSHYNLHNATNQVYAILTTTNLLTPFAVETELWPADTNCQPFTLQNNSRQYLFVRAEDWTGVDSDGDGVPDWWLWEYFHTLGLNATNLDSQGNSLLYDYTNGFDPNVIGFTLSATNFFVNQTTVPVQINLQGGSPAYYAVLVNDTNYADAVWQPYTGTNLIVNLGLSDGVYDVWVGLKGWPTNAAVTWDMDDLTFTLDRSAPAVSVTSAVNTTVTKPYLQLQGFANKPLASLSYDINNAFGFAASQDAFVTDQAFDTNQFDFTTNFFRAFDVPLATNGNWITLRVTDRAGNTTTSNFYVTLDYSLATNPPTVNLIWPQDGMAVSGTNLTIRGTMSDETGTIQAQTVDEDGNTNLIAGIVERNGMFWIENVPLNGETAITLQVTDAAGNVTAIDFTVEPSDLILTITGTPTGDDLWHGAGMVYGTVSDPAATVIINGTNAVVDGFYPNAEGTYNWSATSVPVSGQGTATFDAVAYPGQSSMSSNLRAMAMNAATPSTPPANTSLAVEMQPYLAMISYNGTEVQKYTALDYGYAWYQQTVKNQIAQPVAGTNGQWVLNDRRTNSMYWYEQEGSSSGSGHTKYMWGESPPDDGQEHTDNSWGGSYDGPAQWPYWDGVSLELLRAMPHKDQSWGCASCGPGYMWNTVRHYFADGIQYHWDLGGNTTFDLNVNAKTQMKLFTGGKAQVSRKNLFEIDASATEILRPPLDYGTGYPWWDVPGKAVDNASLTVAGKSVGADGKLWLVLPDNSDMDLTVIAPGKKHYDANATQQKYKLFITANGAILDSDKVAPGASSFWVGQQITFSPIWWPTTPPFANSTQKWSLPAAKYVNHTWQLNNTYPQPNGLPPVVEFYGSVNYDVDYSLLNNYSTACWYVRNFQAQAAKVGMDLTFANGQKVFVFGKGQLDMHRPNLVGSNDCEDKNYNYSAWSSPCLYLDSDTDDVLTPHSNWNSVVILGGDHGGYSRHWASYTYRTGDQFGFTQIVNGYRETNGVPIINTGGTYWLDPNDSFANKYSKTNPQADGSWLIQQTDHPGSGLMMSETSVNDQFKDYFQYLPPGNDSITVTLGSVEWSWGFIAQYTNNSWTVTPSNLSSGSYQDDDTFPEWTGIVPGQTDF